MDIKQEITKILTEIFGESVKESIDKNYDSNNPEELVKLAYHMLVGYVGESNAERLLENVLKKFPNLKFK